jgi:hypothetical protein
MCKTVQLAGTSIFDDYGDDANDNDDDMDDEI